MALRGIVLLSSSVILHWSIASAIVLGTGGHAKAVTTSDPSLEIDVAVEEPPAPAAKEVEEEAPAEPAKIASNTSAPPPTHTHDYPVPPSHDARPHDPSLRHDHDDDHDHDHAEPAQAAPALTATDTSALPRFTIAIGNGAPTGGSVSQSGVGNGGSPAATSAPPVVLTPEGVSVQAHALGRPDPAYPPAARADDREGDVGLVIVVDESGTVIDARISRPAGHGFDESALAAIKRLRFSPAQRDGRAVRVRMPWTMQFRLR